MRKLFPANMQQMISDHDDMTPDEKFVFAARELTRYKFALPLHSRLCGGHCKFC